MSPVGRPRSLAVGQEYGTAYGYDTGGRLNRIWDHPALDQGEPQGNPAFAYDYTPDSFSLLHTVTGPAHTVTHTYDTTRDALATKVNSITAGTPSVPSSFAYGVNSIGQRETVDPVSGMNSTYVPKWTWTYDSMGQITTAANRAASNHRAYQFDSIGNCLSRSVGVPPTSTATYTPNALNQYDAITEGSVTFAPTHDDDGNQKDAQILPLGASGPASCVYHWDGENRLVAVKDTNGTTLVSYAYDAFSRLVSRTTIVNNQPATTCYLYDGWNRIAEYAGQALQKTYLRGMDLSGTMQGAGGVGGLLSVSAHDPETGNVTSVHYPTCDGNGNITEYLTAAGDVAAHFEYDPFGNTLAATGDVAQFEYRFSTKPQDSATGLYYYGHRWYDPLTGRWPSRDLIEESGGLNLYGFVGNDGAGWVDILGALSLEEIEKELASDKIKGPWDANKVFGEKQIVDKEGKMGSAYMVLTCNCGIIDLVHFFAGVAEGINDRRRGVDNGKAFMEKKYDSEFGTGGRFRAFIKKTTGNGQGASIDDLPSDALGHLVGNKNPNPGAEGKLDPQWKKDALDLLKKCKPVPQKVLEQFIKENGGLGKYTSDGEWQYAIPISQSKLINRSAKNAGVPLCCEEADGNGAQLELAGIKWKVEKIKDIKGDNAYVPPGYLEYIPEKPSVQSQP